MANKIGNYGSALARYYADLSNERKSAKAQKKEKGTDSSAQIKSASDELKHLQDKFKGYSIVSADYRQGMQYGKSSTTNVAISPSFLKKMADDPELQAKYEKEIASMAELDRENVKTHAASGSRIRKQGWAIDKDGGISKWSVGTRNTSSKRYSLLDVMSGNNSSRKKSTQNSIFSAMTSSTGRRTSTAAKKFALKYGLSGTSSSDISDKLAEIRKSLNLKI